MKKIALYSTFVLGALSAFFLNIHVSGQPSSVLKNISIEMSESHGGERTESK